MKEVWRCQWETIPGDGEHVENFPTLAAAKQAMRQKISQCVDMREYLADLDPKAAEYIGSFLSNPDFPCSEDDAPVDYEEPERGELLLDSDYILWDYPYDAYPYLKTDLLLAKQNADSYEFEFRYNYPAEYSGNGVAELSIKMELKTDYGTSAYPLMVWFALRKEPATQDLIARKIRESWDTVIERKAIGRHLQLLQSVGLPVRRSAEGYYCVGVCGAPVSGIQFTPSAYPLLILLTLEGKPKTQAAIIREIHEKYGVTIGRKAVARHMKLLKALVGFVRKNQDGHYIGE